MLILLSRLLREPHRRHAIVLLSGACVVILAGGAVFAATQHLPVTTGWYWAVTTATTVGYGDITPHNASGRVVASIVMLTTIPMVAAAFALFTGAAVATRLRRLLHMGNELPPRGFRLILGVGGASSTVLDELRRDGEVVLVGEPDRDLGEHVHLVRGSPTDASVLRSAHPELAADALIWGEDDGEVLVSAVLLHEQAPSLPVVAVVRSPSVGEALRELGISEILSADKLLAHAAAKTLEAPHAGELMLRLLYSEQHRLVEEAVPEGAGTRPLSSLRAERGELILGIVHQGAVSLGVGEDPSVEPGDTLLLVTTATP